MSLIRGLTLECGGSTPLCYSTTATCSIQCWRRETKALTKRRQAAALQSLDAIQGSRVTED